MSYTLYINQKEKLAEYPLPAVNNRQLAVDITEVCGCMLSLEVYDGIWRIIGSDDVSVISESSVISDGAVIRLMHGGIQFAVMAKEICAEKNNFEKYSLGEKTSIGRAEDNEIVISDDFTGSHHCVISAENGGFCLTDTSRNGTYVNGDRVHGKIVLNFFDTIHITGHRLIFLGGIIAVCSDGCIVSKLPKADISAVVNNEIYEDDSYYSRAPRRIRPLDTETVEIDDPPAKQKMRSQPLIFIIGPSVTMPIPILVSVLVNIVSSSNSERSGFMYLGTALSVILSALIGTCWALAHQLYNKKMLASDEKERVAAYSKYIEDNRKLLKDKQAKNKQIIEESFLPYEELYKAAEGRRLIWNRNIRQSDFLTIRMGSGKVRLPGDIAVSKQRFSMTDDPLAGYPHELHDEYEYIDGCVSLLPLMKYKMIGAAGDEEKLPLIVNNIICQTAALHCYTDVKIAFIGRETDRKKYLWAKWLPHIFIDGGEHRAIGFDEDSRESTISRIAAELRKRQESTDEKKETVFLPHIIFFCTAPELIRNSALSRFMSEQRGLGITFVLVYGETSRLPNECEAVIECSEEFSGFYRLDGEISEENSISFDFVSGEKAELFAKRISGLYVDETGSGAIPSAVDYFEMIGIGRTEHWDLMKHYKSSRPYEGLRAFIGLGSGNVPVILDIHDKKDGPHGLVAGTTGSGKSETLQTFILSIALNYSPENAAFVLIDYKGGGMANIFEGLPHIAGMVTNLSDEENGGLDLSLTRRACSSLRSEIKHRQKIFKEYGVNSIDAYSRLYDSGKASVPMPHLMIISDEFAELKKEQPDFIRELVSISRVGRSLGIHLILATQKPSGVVDDEIQSNSRFRICLRVQDKQDSIGMIARPDAAFLTEAGRAFLQIGNDERFEEFQSGYSGGEYIPSDTAAASADSEAVMINTDGTPAVVHIRGKSAEKKPSEIEAAVSYIISQTEKLAVPHVRTLWNPPLGKEIFPDMLDDTVTEGVTAAYGLSDDLERQTRHTCSIDLESCSNLKICGNSGSGKTTLLKTLILSAAEKYPPTRFNFYVLDFSGRTFKLFRKLPHCGGAVYEDEPHAVQRLFELIRSSISERKKLFEKAGVGSYREYIRSESLPLILLIIDDLKGFFTVYEQYEEPVEKLARECVRYGVQIIVTVNALSDIKYKMRSSFADTICLRMNEKNEYTEVLERRAEFVPVSAAGRGLTPCGGALIEYQAALPVSGNSEAERADRMKEIFGELSKKYKEMPKAKSIPVIPSDASYNELLEEISPDRLPVGYDLNTAQPYSYAFSDFFCMCVSDAEHSGAERFFGCISAYAAKNNVKIKAVRLNGTAEFPLPENAEIYRNRDDIRRLAKELLEEFSKRNRAVTEYKTSGSDMSRDSFMAERFGRLFVIIDDMAAFCDTVHNDSESRAAYDFADYINQGRDHGVHFFGGYCSKKKTYLGISDIFKSENHGIHFGGKVSDQNALVIDIPLAEKLKTTEPHIGICVGADRIVNVYVPDMN